MDKEPKGVIAAPWIQGAIIAMAVGLGSFVLRDSPYVSHRQQDDPSRFVQQFSRQDVDARLWQDPIGVVERAREADSKASDAQAGKAKTGPKTGAHSAGDMRKQIEERNGGGKRVGVLAVMLRGGPHSEYVEKRRRTRYAVLAGASVMGFAPRDSDHLGWFHRPPEAQPSSEPSLRPGSQAIPYEWLELAPEKERAVANDGVTDLLVLWLDDRLYADGYPVRQLDALAGNLTHFDPASRDNIPWRIIGPGRSDNLKAIVAEANQPRKSPPPPSYSRFYFYAATATVPDDVLLEEKLLGNDPVAQRDSLPSKLSTHLHDRLGITFTRTIGTDARLVRSLVDELELRTLRPGPLKEEKDFDYQQVCRSLAHPRALSHIAVIAEWDTLYGRSLRSLLRASRIHQGYCVDRYSYMRGLDGELPNSSRADGEAEPSKSSGDPERKDADRRKDGTFIERAEGQSQFDYLRRLSKKLRERDAELRLNSKDGMGLRAIGVLGTDVNDKLLLLQALRPEFPDALFFTTELDARYLDPREQAWTRNLIVASSFGLRLNDELQEGIPPFRDSYQTAVFFATRLLIDDAMGHVGSQGVKSSGIGDTALAKQGNDRWSVQLMTWLCKPRIFEIGRTSAFDFAGRRPSAPPDPSWARLLPAAHAGNGGNVAKPSAPQCRGQNWFEKCDDIHPPGSNTAPSVSLEGRWLVCSLLLLVLVPAAAACFGGVGPFVAFLRPPRELPKFARHAFTATLCLLLAVVLPLAVALAWPAFTEWLTRDGKPLVLAEGISLWPSELIRLCVLLVGAVLLLRSWRKLAVNQEDITSRFSLEPERSKIERDQIKAESNLSWRTRVANIFRLDEVAPQLLPASARSVLPKEVVKIWQRHIVQSRFGARIGRAAACMAVTLLLTACITQVLGEAPLQAHFVPVRGELSRWVHSLLHFAVFLMLYMVVLFVLDAALLCTSFIHLLREQHRMWPTGTLNRFEDELGFRHVTLVDHWIDLEFLAERTQAINRLIYYPFILLSLVLFSRSMVFDHWTMPLSGKVLALLGALIALCGPVALRTAVERSRTEAVHAVDTALIQASSDPRPAAVAATQAERPGPPCVHQLELLKERILRLHGGAFAPYSQQPLLKALVLPFITVGGTSLLELLRVANI